MANSGNRGLTGRLTGGLTGALGRLAFLRVELKGRTVLEASLLGLIVVIGVLFRIMPLRYGVYFSSEADTAFQYRVTQYVVEHGYSAWFSWHDTMSWYPWGRDISLNTFPGLPFSAAFLYSLLQALGVDVSLYNVCIFFPVLMAALTIVAVYFLGRDLGGRGVGLFAAFFMAVSSAFINRSNMGWFDDETIGIFGMVTLSLFFLRSTEQGRSVVRSVAYAVAAGLTLGYLSASWGASRYAVGLLALFVFASLVANLYNRRYLIAYGLAMGINYVIAIFIPRLGFGYIQSMDNAAVAGLFLFLLFYEAVRGRIKLGRLLFVVGASFAAIVGALLILEYLGVISPLASKFLAVIFPQTRETSAIIQSVAEHKMAAWAVYFSDFGFTLALALFGSYFVLRKVGEKKLYGLLFFLSSAYFAGSFIRLFTILAVPASLMAAYGLKELLSPFMSIMSQRAAERRPRRRRAMFGVSREMGIIFTVIIIAATLPTIWSAADISNSPSTMASTVPVQIGGSYPQDWLQALDWMRDNLPGDAIVVSWWDYGYWIQTLANRTTLADGSTLNTTQIAKIGRILMLNESESLPLLKSFNATHIVVYGTWNPTNPNQEWPFGDNAKFLWMVKIAGLNETDYVSGNQYAVKYYESTLYNLMRGMANPAHFKLVYKSEYNWVLVYEIEY